MGKIIKRTIEAVIYVSSNGRETPLQQMEDPHLVNAFGQACASGDEALIKSLREEIQRRLSEAKSQE